MEFDVDVHLEHFMDNYVRHRHATAVGVASVLSSISRLSCPHLGGAQPPDASASSETHNCTADAAPFFDAFRIETPPRRTHCYKKCAATATGRRRPAFERVELSTDDVGVWLLRLI
eukprot:Selendium_serpulae@DN862_c0_g1_i1.p1